MHSTESIKKTNAEMAVELEMDRQTKVFNNRLWLVNLFEAVSNARGILSGAPIEWEEELEALQHMYTRVKKELSK